MLKNYLKIAGRNIGRNKAFSAINIVGLAIGVAACLLILQYVAFELSYDDFNKNKEQIYRVTQDRYNEGKLSTQWAAGVMAAGNSFKEAFPEVEDYVKILQRGSTILDFGEKSRKVEKVAITSSSFFSIFTYPMIYGDPKTALTDINSIVISQSVSQSLFGDENPVGKTVQRNKKRPFKITGVYADMPANSHFKADILVSYATFLDDVKPNNPETAWQWDGCLTYVKLRAGTDTKVLEAKFPALVDKLAGEEHKKYNSAAIYHLQPIKDIHLYSHLMMEAEPNGDGNTVYLLLGIAFFIVVIAWVNYINLATARAVNRAKEVGVRKAVGSQRSQLIWQFMTESVVLNGLSIGLAIVFVMLALPGFNEMSGQQLSFTLIQGKVFWLPLAVLFLVGAFFSGLYPAFVLSGYKPVSVLKGKVGNTFQGILLRKSLVVFQFAASMFLLVGTMSVFHQINFMRNQSLGLDIDQTLIINPPIVAEDSTFMRQMAAFKEELLRQSGIKKVAASGVVPGEASQWNAGGIRLKGADDKMGKQYRVLAVDHDFVDAYSMKLLAGRNFSKDFGADPKAVIFNKMGAKQLGFNNPEEAIGKEIDFWGEIFTIVGVTDNFHQQSLKDAYEPLIIRLMPDVRGYFSIKLNTGSVNQTIEKIHTEWNKFFPGNPFEYQFLNERYNNQYRADQRFGQVFGVFTGLAILVACLGLFGLASFTTAQRTKEIGIRKVLGSSVFEIVSMLFKEFTTLIFIAFVVAMPTAWYAVDRWLQGYAFHASIVWWLFVLPLVMVLLIAIITVSFQSIKAALMNPVKALRSE